MIDVDNLLCFDGLFLMMYIIAGVKRLSVKQ